MITARTADKGKATVARIAREGCRGADIGFEVLELGSLESVRSFHRPLPGRPRPPRRPDRQRRHHGGAVRSHRRRLRAAARHQPPHPLAGVVSAVTCAPRAAGPGVVGPTSAAAPRPTSSGTTPTSSRTEYSEDGCLRAVEDGQRPPRRRARTALRAPRRARLAVHPGVVATQLGRNFTPDVMEDLKARAAANPAGAGTLPPVVGTDVGAATSVWAATAPRARSAGRHVPRRLRRRLRPDYAMDPEAARRSCGPSARSWWARPSRSPPLTPDA